MQAGSSGRHYGAEATRQSGNRVYAVFTNMDRSLTSNGSISENIFPVVEAALGGAGKNRQPEKE